MVLEKPTCDLRHTVTVAGDRHPWLERQAFSEAMAESQLSACMEHSTPNLPMA